ncbi:hypothetical protein [Streptomyces sp. NPDC047024]|uniref:hypothetical protein n=1 Tax=Streptomyces sp. NPDC047024 TaxID=3155476 RepID=UPI0034015381
MASDARARLSEAFELFGIDGVLVVIHEPNDPSGVAVEGADTPPHSVVTHSRLRERVAEANARSRGERL